jgi:hypothetical protein
MEHPSPEIQIVLDTIRRENAHTRIVFGVGIIILALVLMYIAPTVIRTQFADSLGSSDQIDFASGVHGAPSKAAHPGTAAVMTHSTTTSTTTATTTVNMASSTAK